jgi:hypothetical protein
MPWIVLGEAFARDRERLTGAGAGPEFSSVRPASKSSCCAPEPSAGEEMHLREASQVAWLDVGDASSVHNSVCNDAILNQAFEDVRGGWFQLVVISGHFALRSCNLNVFPVFFGV